MLITVPSKNGIMSKGGQDIDAKARNFAEWLNTPIDLTSQDPRFEVRRATRDDFDQIYDLVDTVFEQTRPRAAYEWLYRANPAGTARCWLVIERDSGQLVASESRFPWPLAHGTKRIECILSGDFATLPRRQRQGIFQLRSEIRDSHPWRNRTIALSVPNAKSRGALAKHGRAHAILGPFPRGVLLLDGADYLRYHGFPHSAARVVGGAADAALGLWHRSVLPSASNIRVEELNHFDSSLDALTHRCMSTPTYWCPHEADFLNWRYFENPVTSYLARVALVDDEVSGYGVVRITDERATLMEFVASPAPQPLAGVLLRAIASAAREAGCHLLEFYATSGWRFWSLFRRAGLVSCKSEIRLSARCPGRADVSQEENWQLLPGDSDVL